MKIHRARVVGTFVTLTGSTTNLTGSFRGSFEGDEKLATTGSNTFNGNQTVNGDMTVTGRIVAEEFHTEFISSSIIYKSGSTKFGDSLDDNHGFTGSLSISGSLNINGTSYSAATSGTSGVNGSSGDTGSSGSAGTSGVDGTSGTSGADGSSGATGSSGSAGTSGSSGLSVGNVYLHTQSSSSSTWTITHNLNYKYLSVTVYDSSDNVMLPESIIADSANQLTISFGVSESGYAMLSYGASSSGTSGASGNSGTSGSSGSSGTSAGSASRNVTTFIATSGQTTFTISGGYTVGLVDVFVNGVRYSPTDFTATNGTTVVLGVGVDVDDVVDIIDYVSSMTAIAGEGTTSTIPKYTASGTIGNSIITDNGTNATVNGSLTVTGNLTAQQFIISSSVTHLTESFASGSHKFGDSSDDNHNFTGSLIVSGSANPLNVGTNLLFVSSSGNVGVGTSSPYGQFTIQNIASNIGGVNFGDATDASSRRWQLRNDTDVFGDFSIRQSTTQNGSTYINRLYVSSSGNIGVGTSTPLSTLVVSATNSGGRGGEISIINSGTAANSEAALNFGFGTSTYNGDNGNAQIKALMTNVNEATDIVFSNWSGASFIERMRITSSGSIGIGTTSPLTLLEVGNSAYATSSILTITSAAGQQTGLLFRSATTSGYYIYRPANTTDLRFYDNVGSADRVTILQGGNVGIGTSSPSVLLHVNGIMYATKIGGNTSTPAIQVRGSGGGPRIQTYGLDADGQAWMGLGTDMGGNPYEHSVYFSEPSSSPSAGRVTFGGFDGTTYNTKMTILRNGSIGAPTGTNIYNPSDARLKQNISTTTYGLSTISELNPVKFNWINNFVESEDDKDMLGFIAQEVQTVIPEAVESFGGDINLNGEVIDNPLRVNEKFIIPVLVKAIQELSAELTSAKQEIELLKLK